MSTRRFIPVAAPVLNGNEKAYVLDCLDSSWISSSGRYVERFERAFADFCSAKHAASCCNGTVALHLALMALGVKQGDEVIVPTLTFVATANAVAYCGARPLFVDSEPDTWNMDPALIEQRITPRTKGIIVVHLYGHPVDLDAVLSVARRHGLFVIEDAAEAHGAKYKGRAIGSVGDVATFSFYGNKIITTGEGGMVVTNDGMLMTKVRRLKGQGMDPNRRYWFPTIGYNYRMTNVAAAIGLAQLERVEWHTERRREVAGWYHACLADTTSLVLPIEKEWARNVYWMFTVVLDDSVTKSRDQVAKDLLAEGIETRPVFYPVHSLPPYRRLSRGQSFPVADRIAARGINLPTWAGLTREDVEFISQALKRTIRSPA
ncbi:MAG: DegT/DnrJ/EryC1/StrS family aminotransferase [Chloroflexota bacterium]